MIAIDSSAIIAIFRQEDDAVHYARRIATDDDPIMSAANLVETSIVLRGLKKLLPTRPSDGLTTSSKRRASGSSR
jgi:ribonuclease VapC